MKNFATVVVVLLAGVVEALCQTNHTSTKGPITKEELLRLLPRSIDLIEPEEVANEQKLKSYGASLLPVIAEALAESTNTFEIGRLVGLARGIPGDHAQIARQLHNLLDGNDDAKMIAVLALKDIGSTADCPRLLRLLDDRNEFIRVNAARALATLGDEETLIRMKDVLAKRKSELGMDALRKDSSVSEMEKAIDALHQKVVDRRGKGTANQEP